MPITSPRLLIESIRETEPPLLPPLPVPVGLEVPEVEDPGTNVALGLAMHDSAADAGFTDAELEFTWAFPPKLHALELRF